MNTTSKAVIDNESKRVIREYTSRRSWRAKNLSIGASMSSRVDRHASRTTGQIHRFRLGPKGLKDTSNQLRKLRQDFSVTSLKSDEQPSTVSTTCRVPPFCNIPDLGRTLSESRRRIIEKVDEDELCPGCKHNTAFSHQLDDFIPENCLMAVGSAADQQQAWVETLPSLQVNPLHSPSSNAMDPFNTMSVNISPREQLLLRYYCKYKSKC